MALEFRGYLSPGVVLLAFDWPEGKDNSDFLGFSIQRTPGFGNNASSYLMNRIGFNGPPKDGSWKPSNLWPIQKFYWWDAQINDADRGKSFTYRLAPIKGPAANPTEYSGVSASITLKIPQNVENGVGTWFNRAVVSSQSFMREFGANPTGAKLQQAYEWLSNGLQAVIPDFLKKSDTAAGAIYHLTDNVLGTEQAMLNFPGDLGLVYDAVPHNDSKTHQPIPNPNESAIHYLSANPKIKFYARTNTSIMHDKFLVRLSNGHPTAVLMGSANFTTEGLSTQANLLHTWESPQLAQAYLQREQLLQADPTAKQTAANAKWTGPIQAGDAKVSVIFAPESAGKRASLDRIVNAVKNATNSAVFCLYSPTDTDLLNALLALPNAQKMMFGLINEIPQKDPSTAKHPNQVMVTIYNRTKKGKTFDVVGHDQFGKNNTPNGFWWETSSLGGQSKFPVYIHHKFVVIDGETDHPVIYSGSANLSKNSTNHNDENLLEITDCPRLAQIYLAEFMRLFEHYRARQAFDERTSGASDTFKLTSDSSWSKDWYAPGAKSNSRVALALPPGSQAPVAAKTRGAAAGANASSKRSSATKTNGRKKKSRSAR
jgi:phosphatidylserine/phosphatidylglycerophosphate/cardiolipin synthase-like enzyme